MRTGALLAVPAALLLFPWLYYLLGDRLSPAALAAVLALLAAGRLLLARTIPWRLRASGVGGLGAFVLAVAWLDADVLLRLYPSAVNLVLLAGAAYTLWRPPSAIERLSRLAGMPMSAAGVVYTRNLTGLWCVFFLGNALVAAYTALAQPLSVWAFYNGFLSYVLVGTLLAIEFAYRQHFKRRVAARSE